MSRRTAKAEFGVVRPILDRAHHKVSCRCNDGAADAFVERAHGDLVDTALRGLARPAEAHLHAGKALQLDRHVFHDMCGPGAFLQSQQETSWFADTAAVSR